MKCATMNRFILDSHFIVLRPFILPTLILHFTIHVRAQIKVRLYSPRHSILRNSYPIRHTTQVSFAKASERSKGVVGREEAL